MEVVYDADLATPSEELTPQYREYPEEDVLCTDEVEKIPVEKPGLENTGNVSFGVPRGETGKCMVKTTVEKTFIQIYGFEVAL